MDVASERWIQPTPQSFINSIPTSSRPLQEQKFVLFEHCALDCSCYCLCFLCLGHPHRTSMLGWRWSWFGGCSLPVFCCGNDELQVPWRHRTERHHPQQLQQYQRPMLWQVHCCCCLSRRERLHLMNPQRERLRPDHQ